MDNNGRQVHTADRYSNQWCTWNKCKCWTISIDTFPKDFFKTFLTSEILVIMVTETITYVATFIAESNLLSIYRGKDTRAG